MKPLKELISERKKKYFEPKNCPTDGWTLDRVYDDAISECLEELSKSAGEGFNETAARDHFHRENPKLYRDGVYLNKKVSYAKWQWEQDNLIIQSLRLRIAELEGEK